jgi:hypothetical protein
MLKLGVMRYYWSGCGKRDTSARTAVHERKQAGPVRGGRNVQIETLLREGVLVGRFLINVWKILECRNY